MKIGDHVELIDDNWRGYFIINLQKWKPNNMKYPVKGVVYTIRDIGTHLSTAGNAHGIPALLLEEIRNECHPATGNEVCFQARRFRKLDLPPSIEQEIKELLEEPVII
jgi:hypothetical protein